MFSLRYLITLSTAVLTASASAQNPPAQPLQADPGADYFARARQLFEMAQSSDDEQEKQANYKKVIPILRDYTQRFPRHHYTQAAYYYLAESYNELGQASEAIPILQLIVSRYKTGTYVAAAAYRLAYNDYSAKRYASAAHLFSITAANVKQPEDKLRSTYFQAQCYLLLQQNDKAEPLLNTVASSAVDTPFRDQACMTIGQILFTKKQYAKALTQFERVIKPKQTPGILAEASLQAAKASAALKQFDKAKAHFQRVLDTRDPLWTPLAHIGLLTLLYQDKDYDAIITQAKNHDVELDKKLLTKQGVIVGQAYFKKKLYTQAIDYFIDIEKSAPQTKEALEAGYFKLLCFYNIDGSNIPQQVDLFVTNNAVGNGTHKYIHQAFLLKAEALFANKKFKEAAQAYASIDPQFIDKKNLPSLLFKKGWSFSLVGNHEGAIETFTQLLEKAPDFEKAIDATSKRGLSYKELGDRVKALRDFDAVIKAKPKSQLASLALYESAQIQRKAEQFEDMNERLETLLANFPDLPEKTRANSHYWAGYGYFKLTDYIPATTHLEQAIDLAPDAYGKKATIILVLCQHALKDVDGLKTTLAKADKFKLSKKIPLPVYRWLGSQCHNAGDYKDAVTYLKKGIEEGVPRSTPSIIWLLLAKSQLHIDDFKDALVSIDHYLSVEDKPEKKADALLDKSKILIGLEQYDQAKATATTALEMQPVGRTKAGLLMAIGDCAYLTKDFKGAAEHYVLIVETFPDFPSHKIALLRLIESMEKSNKAAAATPYKEMLKKLYP